MNSAHPHAARLRFRPLAAENLQRFRALACDEHIRRYLLDGQTVSEAWCRQIAETTAAEAARSGLGLWLLHDIETTEALGFAGFLRFDAPDSELQLLYALTADHSGRGYAREAAVALIDFARERAAQSDIVAAVDEPNGASRRVLTRLGFDCVGAIPGMFGRKLQYRLPAGRPPRERRTQRLVLRPFRDADRESFACLNADPRVMQHFPSALTRTESDALVDRALAHFSTQGFGLWALEHPHLIGCIGFTGLGVPTFQSHFTPCMEIGWRLAAEHWGQGYAQEAARAALHTAFVHLQRDQIVSFTAARNEPSRRLMERLGLSRNPGEDFEHPNVAPGHPLRRHVLYRLDAANWRMSDRAERNPSGTPGE